MSNLKWSSDRHLLTPRDTTKFSNWGCTTGEISEHSSEDENCSTKKEQAEEEFFVYESLEDLGPCPAFRFMPSKIKVMKMVLKAAFYHEQTGGIHI